MRIMIHGRDERGLKVTTYHLSESFDSDQLIQDLGRSFGFRKEPPRSVSQIIFDTFDWRLLKKGKTLVREGYRLFLTALDRWDPEDLVTWKRRKPPEFWWDFPEGGLKPKLKSLLDVRALLPVMRVSKNMRLLRILNADDKTVAKIQFEAYRARAESGPSSRIEGLTHLPVLGYAAEFREVQKFLADAGLTEEKDSIYVKLMRNLGLEPGSYSSKFRIDLEPDLPAVEAARRIIGHLLGIMNMNKAGLIADIDTEFLHDYRVSIRRIRSVLRQMKGVFPKEKTAGFRTAFAEIGKSTNRLRDLDVYLLKKDPYRAILPDYLAPGLDRLFQDLTQQRDNEHASVAKALQSARYRRTVTRWEKFVASRANYTEEEAPQAGRPIHELGCDLIYKRYQKIIGSGEKITDDSPDEELHRLRISCKRLRYLLEFFASLFPEKEIGRLIGQLKKLQDHLGDFNDLCVQQRQLEEYLIRLEESPEKTALAAAAVGGLITSLNLKQQAVRLDFKKRFQAFSSRNNQRHFQRLFQPSRPVGEAK